MIDIAMLGFGHNGWGHLKVLQMHPQLRGRARVAGIFDPSQDIQDKLRAKGIKVLASADEAINADGIQAIMICSPPQFHANQAVQALESGKHVFSEVPMALKTGEIERIIAAEDASRKKYQFGENYIFYAEVLFASHLVMSGKIGTPVYAEAEYLHDVTYRWLQEGHGDAKTPRRDSWYSLFDPLAYAHTIGPAQVALGGLEHPAPFIEVSSYATDLGGENKDPICKPSHAFHVGLFKTASGAIAKCASAYVIAREPVRMGIQIVGELGTYEAPRYGKKGRLFVANDHVITPTHHRAGKATTIGRWQLQKVKSPGLQKDLTAMARVVDDWLSGAFAATEPIVRGAIDGLAHEDPPALLARLAA
ncbi:MAG: Gfo/Idh/MocA family oxidoreductase, partial [Candidatus Lokiarchaeota archaeon]|nr:Gfo/Idh/MocA family oxidoreductase [Candidatus Lokiarchaeota archaeon]